MLNGKVAIVTGSASGIGRAIAQRFAESGCAVVIGDINAAGGEESARMIQEGGGRALVVEMDLGRPADTERTVNAAVEQFGGLDILVNCAAVMGAQKPLIEMEFADWQDVLDANLTGTFRLSQAAARVMLRQGRGGVIVNILAIQSSMPLIHRGAYGSSKGALETMTRALAVELAGDGIRVNGIAVGTVYTEGVAGALSQAAAEAPPEVDRAAATLLGRMGRPADIAGVALFLASEESSYLTGAILPADGGRLMSRKPDPFLAAQLASPRTSS